MKKNILAVIAALILIPQLCAARTTPYLIEYDNPFAPKKIYMHIAGEILLGPTTGFYIVKLSSNGILLPDNTVLTSTGNYVSKTGESVVMPYFTATAGYVCPDGTIMTSTSAFAPAGVIGDMIKAVYDSDGNGIIDNSEMLNGYHYDAFLSTNGGSINGNISIYGKVDTKTNAIFISSSIVGVTRIEWADGTVQVSSPAGVGGTGVVNLWTQGTGDNIYKEYGNIGIGITNPQYKLDVAGQLNTGNYSFFTSSSIVGIKEIRWADGTIQVSSPIASGNSGSGGVADNMGNHVATTTLNMNGNWISGDGDNEGIFIGPEGNAGFGTDNPGSKIEVVDGNIKISTNTGSGYGVIFPDGSKMTSAGVGSIDSLSATGNATIESDTDADGNGYVVFKTSAIERARISNNGNLGLNNTDPSYPIDIIQSQADKGIRISPGIGSPYYMRMGIDDSTNRGVIESNAGTWFRQGNVITEGPGGAHTQILADWNGEMEPAYSFAFDPDTGMDCGTVGELWWTCGGNMKMKLNATGLGIGLGPYGVTEKLDVNGNIKCTGTLNTGQGATEVYLMNQNLMNTDNVAFNTVNTGYGANELYPMNQSVTNTSNVNFNYIGVHDGYSYEPSIRFKDDTDTGIWQPTLNNMAFSVGGNEAMRIDYQGNIGIGIESLEYDARLVVNGQIKNGDYAIFNSSSLAGVKRIEFDDGTVQTTAAGGGGSDTDWAETQQDNNSFQEEHASGDNLPFYLNYSSPTIITQKFVAQETRYIDEIVYAAYIWIGEPSPNQSWLTVGIADENYNLLSSTTCFIPLWGNFSSHITTATIPSVLLTKGETYNIYISTNWFEGGTPFGPVPGARVYFTTWTVCEGNLMTYNNTDGWDEYSDYDLFFKLYGHDEVVHAENKKVGINTASPTSMLDVNGDIEIDKLYAFYFGDPATDGTWRIIRDGNNLVFQRRESGSYVSKNTIVP